MANANIPLVMTETACAEKTSKKKIDRQTLEPCSAVVSPLLALRCCCEPTACPHASLLWISDRGGAFIISLIYDFIPFECQWDLPGMTRR